MDVLIRNRVPRTIQWLLNVFVIYLFLFTAFRLATALVFKPVNIAFLDLIPSFWLGLKYDLRWIALILMPIALLSLFPRLSPYYSYKNKKRWTIYLGIVTLLVLFFYGADFGQFSYIKSRLNADALNFVEDPKDNLLVVWRSYPVIWIVFALIGAVLMMTWMFRRVHVEVADMNSAVHKFDYRRRYHLAALMILSWFLYGFLTWGPLNVFRAFNLNDDFKSNLALNPLQNFFTSLRLTKPDYSTNAKPYYPIMRSFLGMEKMNNADYPFARAQQPISIIPETKPNVVLIVCKNLSMYKTSMGGNKLNATPFLYELSQKGVFFENCFAPAHGTARAIYAILTGIPDVQGRKFSAKNPLTLHQYSLLNNIDSYEKVFFSGANAPLKNFEPLLQQIDGINIVRQEDFKVQPTTVWGLNDTDLLLEVGEKLNQLSSPFFAMVHTSNNQKPFKQESENVNWRNLRMMEKDSLKRYGFESWEEYLSLSYSDYALEQFFNSVSTQPYFDNTLFVLVGDHGFEGETMDYAGGPWSSHRLNELHVPLLFYAPKLLTPQHIEKVVSQIDILPAITALLQEPVMNTTLGRNPFDVKPLEEGAFIIQHHWGWIGFLNRDFYYRKNTANGSEEIFSLGQLPVSDSVKTKMRQLSTAIYESSRWLLYHNQPRSFSPR